MMQGLSPMSGVLSGPPKRLASKRYLLQFLLLLLSLGFVCGRSNAAPEFQHTPVISARPALPFAFADFDGDHHPDIVSVRTGRREASSTHYLIEFQVTAVGQQQVSVSGPPGGIQIVARDVNGDHAVDLVITTALLKQPIAVLLNDGHGGFSQVGPAAFPEIFSISETKWAPTSASPVTNAVWVPPRSGAGVNSAEKSLFSGQLPAAFISSTKTGFPHSPFVVSHAGRAPPSELFHL
jgi:hypothetical protein